MNILEQGADHQHHRGQHHEEEGDEGHNLGAETEGRIFKQIPPPLLGPPNTSVRKYEHVVLLPLRGLLHHVLPAIVGLLAARLHEELADPPVGQLLAEGNGTGFM